METIEEGLKLFVYLYLFWSVINQLIPEAYALASYTRKNGLYFGLKATIGTLLSCTKCFFFWGTLIATGSIFISALFALIAQLIGKNL